MPAGNGPPWRLIAADDEAAQRRLLEDIFGRAPFAIELFERGEELLALASADPPDVVLLDIRMPSMDGFEILRRLRSQAVTASIPAIAVTAETSRADVQRMEDAGFTAVVAKPYEIPHLVRVVREVLLARGVGAG